MASKPESNAMDQLKLFSNEQINSIKEIVLHSVLEILPTIINEITPTIIKSAENIIKDKITGNISLPTSTTAQPGDSEYHSFNAEKIGREIENINHVFLNKKLGYRQNLF